MGAATLLILEDTGNDRSADQWHDSYLSAGFAYDEQFAHWYTRA